MARLKFGLFFFYKNYQINYLARARARNGLLLGRQVHVLNNRTFSCARVTKINHRLISGRIFHLPNCNLFEKSLCLFGSAFIGFRKPFALRREKDYSICHIFVRAKSIWSRHLLNSAGGKVGRIS